MTDNLPERVSTETLKEIVRKRGIGTYSRESRLMAEEILARREAEERAVNPYLGMCP